VNGKRHFRILMKNRDRAPVSPEDRGFARQGLVQLAEAEGYKLTGDMALLSSDYYDEERVYIAAYGSYAVRDEAVAARQGAQAAPQGRTDVLALRAHRTPLHSTQVITSAVERALTSRKPLAALVALHLLHIPATSNEEAGQAHGTLKTIFENLP